METTAGTEPSEGTVESATDSAGASATTEGGGGGSESASGVAFPVTPGPDWPDEIVFTLTPSQEAGGLIETAEPLAEALAERLGVDVTPQLPSDYAGVIVALQSGQAQLAGGLGPLQMVQAEDEAGADLILQSERFGSYEYVTQWFTNDPDTYCEEAPVADPESGFLFCNGVTAGAPASDGPIGEEHLADVAGKTVAFVDQGSASGYLVPSLQLINAGVDPIEDITALFAGGHDAAVQAVYDGDADVGVSFNDARGQMAEQIPDVGEQVVVFAWSFPIPNDGFAVAGDLPDDLNEAITAALLDIAETEPEVLAEVYEIDGLTPVDSADYDVIREMRTELGDLLE
jgi:phosphonate transport system substrate-binding protein